MDITTSEGLERALHLATLAGDSQPPASPEDLARLEQGLGLAVPDLLKRLLALSNGLVIDAEEINLMPVGSGQSGVGSSAGILDVWAFYRERIAEDPDGDWKGWIGRDAIPLVRKADGDFMVWRSDEKAVFDHYPAEGSSDDADLPSLEAWLGWVVGSGIAKALDRQADDVDVDAFDVVDALEQIDGPAENREFAVLDRVGKIVEELLARDIDAATAVERAQAELVITED
jgi:hypothetical protein